MRRFIRDIVHCVQYGHIYPRCRVSTAEKPPSLLTDDLVWKFGVLHEVLIYFTEHTYHASVYLQSVFENAMSCKLPNWGPGRMPIRIRELETFWLYKLGVHVLKCGIKIYANMSLTESVFTRCARPWDVP